MPKFLSWSPLPAAFLAILAATLPSAGLAADRASILTLKNVGLAQLEEGKNAEAKETFAKLAAQVADDPLPAADGAVAALRANDLPSADALLAKALALAPGRSDLLMISAAIENAKNRQPEMRAALAKAATASGRNLEARWRWIKSAEIDPAVKSDLKTREKYLKEIVDASPSNVPALLKMLLVQLEAGEVAPAKATLATLESVLAPIDPKTGKYVTEGKTLLGAGNSKDAALKFRVIENLLRVGDRYRASLSELYTDVVGLPVISFAAKFEESLRPKAGAPVAVSFAENKTVPKDLSPTKLLHRADWKNRGGSDDYAVPAPHKRATFIDFDNEGDLDLYLFGAAGPDKSTRNGLDGSWVDVTADTGDPKFSSLRVVVDDLDRDGDIDLVSVTGTGDLVVRSNLRQGRFRSIDLKVPGSIDVAAADLDADGWPDLVAATKNGIALLVNKGDGSFDRAAGGDLAKLPAGFAPRRIAIADLDNDGFPDIVLGGEAGIVFFRNAGLRTFTAWSAAPGGVGRVDEIVAIDNDRDGDLDLLIDDAGKSRLFTNGGGNANGWLDVVLEGLPAGSQKVNRNGVGSLVEIKAGDLYVAQTVSVLPTHFGLGKHSKADVVRCLWTNGIPQNLFDQKAKSTVKEVQQLKGSCPFVYAFDGQNGKWNFVSDALGRAPIGLLYDGVHLAGADPREWLLVGPGQLSPTPDGKLLLDYTEELWEAVYLDMVHLAAVDHPEGTAVVPNERMIPGPTEKKLFTVANPRPVRAATADGADATDLLARADRLPRDLGMN